MYAAVPMTQTRLRRAGSPAVLVALRRDRRPADLGAVSLARPKSSTFAWPRRGDEDVRRLDVAMDDALRMRGVERVGDLDAELDDAIELERLPVDRDA